MSVTGEFGGSALRCVETLLSHNCVHFIATDAHRANRRPPILSKGRDAATRIIGVEAARRLVEGNPLSVLRGETVGADSVLPFDSPRNQTIFSSFVPGWKIGPEGITSGSAPPNREQDGLACVAIPSEIAA